MLPLALKKPGLLIGPYESEDKMKIQEDWYDEGVPKGFGKELYESDLDRLDKCIEHVMDLLPIIQETDIQVRMEYLLSIIRIVGREINRFK